MKDKPLTRSEKIRQVNEALRRSEEQFRLFVTASSVMVYKMSADWTEMFNLDGRNILADTDNPTGDWTQKYIPDTERALVWQAITHAINTKSIFQLEHRVIQADGSIGWISSRAVPALDDDGQLLEWLGAGTDITLRKEEELRSAFLFHLSDQIRAINEPSVLQETVSRLLGSYLQADRAAFGELEAGTGAITITGDWSRTGIPPLAGHFPINNFGAFLTAKLRKGKVAVVEDVLADPDAKADYDNAWKPIGVHSAIGYPVMKSDRMVAVFFIHSLRPRKWADGDIRLVSDVAGRTWEAVERVRAEKALQETEQRLKNVLEILPVGVGFYDNSGGFYLVNNVMQSYLPNGHMPSRDNDRGWRWQAWDERGKLIDPQDFPGASALRGESVVPGLEMLYTKDSGAEVWTRVASLTVKDAENQVIGSLVTITDIDNLKRNAEALRANEERLQLALNGANIFTWDVDPETGKTNYSKNFKEVTGFEIARRHAGQFYARSSGR